MIAWLRHVLGTDRRHRTAALLLAAVLVVGGLTAVITGLASQQSPPQPRTAAAADTTIPSRPPPTPAEPGRPALPASPPKKISIPAINVHSSLLALGLNKDGSIEVPSMGPNYNHAAWYKYSPTPGQIGPTVVEGHVDSAKKGPSVFFRLGNLKRGDRVSVTRADKITTIFTVDKTVRYPKTHFPTNTVYGGTPDPQLRLITCGGPFDRDTRSYTDNIVVYAHLTATNPARPQ
jgi:sortase (surface protein transpeptidase)